MSRHNIAIMEKKFAISSLTMMLFAYSAAVDDEGRKALDISVEDVKHHATEGTLETFLKESLDSYDASFLAASPAFAAWYLARIKDLCDVNERRKYGIENNGICLLISLTAEIIQQREGIKFD